MVACGARQIGGQVDLEPDLARGGLELQQVEHRAQHAVEIDGGGGPCMFVLLDARQHQEVVDQAAHAVGLFGHDAQEPLARRRILAGRAAQGLDETRQAGDRRLEFVAGIGHEIGAHALGAAQGRSVVQHDQRQRAVGGGPRQPSQMGHHVELRRPRQHQFDHALVGSREVAVGAGLEQRVDGGQELRLAQHRRDIALGTTGTAQQQGGGKIGTHDAALPVETHQGIGKTVDDRLGGGRQIVDRGALATPSGREGGGRGRQFLGGRGEGKTGHHRLALVREFPHESREARQRPEIALDQEHRHHGDASHRDQGGAARQLAEAKEDGERRPRRGQGHGVGNQRSTQRNPVVGHRPTIAG